MPTKAKGSRGTLGTYANKFDPTEASKLLDTFFLIRQNHEEIESEQTILSNKTKSIKCILSKNIF